MIIDFDSNDWMAPLGEALRHSVPKSARRALPFPEITYYEEFILRRLKQVEGIE
ncbi:hypothetical protein ABID26_007008 [Mesorhizobium shonense]|uniref:Uncharacterized protein n=1 Tax=Mesorhizobium shonense TaxID=1209948 RepID=A0ABV2I3U3_9HYPH